MSLVFDVPGAIGYMDKFVHRVDVAVDDIPLLGDLEPDTAMGLEKPDHTPMEAQEIQEGAYNPIDPQHQYASRKTDDVTDFNNIHADPETPILDHDEERKQPSMFRDEISSGENFIPSAITSYYNETAISSKKRNALPDEAFGLPRLRQYPLHDKAHVKQAVRMFGHCKDPKDRETLAKNIFKAMETHKVSMKIGKKNPLYQYAPKNLQETSDLPYCMLGTPSAPMRKRTREDVVREHMHANSSFYNNIFYGEDYRKSITAMQQFQFLGYFHPNLTRMNFVSRLHCVCGGLASPENVDQIYGELKLRKPTELDFNKPLGWYEVKSNEDSESVAEMLVSSGYESEANWFKVDLSDDLQHIFYCLRLYSIMGEIFLDPNFDPDVHFSAEHTAILLDWRQHVQYHYDLYRDAEEPGERMRQRQYLWDLFWSFLDSPNSESAITVNIISMLHNMACVRDQVININEGNESGELITKEKCSAYLIHDLGMTDDLYLLQTTLQYPIIDKTSIRLAMDLIEQIPPDDKEEYVKNLNRKYKEFGCNFSISIDHPYAKYADKEIIANMSHMLMEGETAVDDMGTSTGPTDKVEQPFYKRVDYVKGKLGQNLATIKDLGPNTKPKAEPDYEYQTGIV